MINSTSTIRPGGKQTRLYGAVDKALELFQPRPEPERRRIIVLSDGAETSSERPEYIDEVIAKAEQRRIAIDTIWIGRGPVWSRNLLFEWPSGPTDSIMTPSTPVKSRPPLER